MVGDGSEFEGNLESPDDYDPFGANKPIPRVQLAGPIEPLLTSGTSTNPDEPRTRLPYWDRPKQPRDWYWFLGRLGNSLIILGLLMFLFVGYQLWGTGIEEAQSQNRLENTFAELMSPVSTSVPTTTGEGSEAPVTSEVATSTTLTPVKPISISEGDPIAIIEIPVIGVKKFVVAGVQPSDLKKGPGHYPNTPLPGELGNSAIAGHRTTYGEPFRNLDKLSIGDEIRIT
ncbi:MAG: sortase, partial [Actinomycetota bacterium]